MNSNDRYDAGEEGAAREGERSRDPDNKLARVVALIQAQGIKVVFNARKDARVVEDCSAGADDIAEAYVAAYRGEWDTSDGWLGRNLTMPTLVSQVPAYVAWRDSTRVAREVMGSADWPWRFERDPAWAARMFHEALHEVGYDLGTLLSPDGGTFRYSPSMPEGLRFFVEPFLQQYPDEFVDLLEHTNRQEVNGPSVSDSDPGEGMDEWTA